MFVSGWIDASAGEAGLGLFNSLLTGDEEGAGRSTHRGATEMYHIKITTLGVITSKPWSCN